MLPLRFIREHEALVRKRLATRGGDMPLDELLSLDKQRRRLLTEVEDLRAARKQVSRGIGSASGAERRGSDRTYAPAHVRAFRPGTRTWNGLSIDVDRLLLEIPMLPHASAPVGDADHPRH